jgi:hypothetical protein
MNCIKCGVSWSGYGSVCNVCQQTEKLKDLEKIENKKIKAAEERAIYGEAGKPEAPFGMQILICGGMFVGYISWFNWSDTFILFRLLTSIVGAVIGGVLAIAIYILMSEK